MNHLNYEISPIYGKGLLLQFEFCVPKDGFEALGRTSSWHAAAAAQKSELGIPEAFAGGSKGFPLTQLTCESKNKETKYLDIYRTRN